MSLWIFSGHGKVRILFSRLILFIVLSIGVIFMLGRYTDPSHYSAADPGLKSQEEQPEKKSLEGGKWKLNVPLLGGIEMDGDIPASFFSLSSMDAFSLFSKGISLPSLETAVGQVQKTGRNFLTSALKSAFLIEAVWKTLAENVDAWIFLESACSLCLLYFLLAGRKSVNPDSSSATLRSWLLTVALEFGFAFCFFFLRGMFKSGLQYAAELVLWFEGTTFLVHWIVYLLFEHLKLISARMVFITLATLTGIVYGISVFHLFSLLFQALRNAYSLEVLVVTLFLCIPYIAGTCIVLFMAGDILARAKKGTTDLSQ